MSGSKRATAVPSRPRASTAVSRLLGQIQQTLGVEPIDSVALAGQLKALAEAFSLNLPARVNPPLGGRQKLGLVPELPLPPMTAAGQTFFISHSVDWSFSEDGRSVPAEDIDAENLKNPEIDVLIKPKVRELPPRCPDRGSSGITHAARHVDAGSLAWTQADKCHPTHRHRNSAWLAR